MGLIMVAVLGAVLLSSTEGGFGVGAFALFVLVAFPVYFILHLTGAVILKKLVLARYDAPELKIYGEVSPELQARTAIDPVVNGVKFILWLGKWFAVGAAGLAVAR